MATITLFIRSLSMYILNFHALWFRPTALIAVNCATRSTQLALQEPIITWDMQHAASLGVPMPLYDSKSRHFVSLILRKCISWKERISIASWTLRKLICANTAVASPQGTCPWHRHRSTYPPSMLASPPGQWHKSPLCSNPASFESPFCLPLKYMLKSYCISISF